MIKLISIGPKEHYEILLRLSDDTSGTFDFAPFVEAGTEMTEPLRDPTFFKRCFIELGAIAWPNGFDMSAESLHQRLHEDGKLRHDPKAARAGRDSERQDSARERKNAFATLMKKVSGMNGTYLSAVIPAQAGIQRLWARPAMDSRLRGNDGI